MVKYVITRSNDGQYVNGFDAVAADLAKDQQDLRVFGDQFWNTANQAQAKALQERSQLKPNL